MNNPDFQGQAVVNYCDPQTSFTRIIEHKHFANRHEDKTVITYEYPQEWMSGREPYYPINNKRNEELYQRYVELSREYPDIIFGGRLGTYSYYNMDEVIAKALEDYQRIISPITKTNDLELEKMDEQE